MGQKSIAGADERPADLAEDFSAAWLLTQTGASIRLAPSFDPLVIQWQDIAERERKLGIPPGTPVLVDPARVDDRLNVYFRQGFARDQMSSAMTYAFELKIWLAFLGARDVRWDEAGREDVRSFHTWRVYDIENDGRVSPATWNKGWAALRHFYGWACAEGWVDANPVGQQDRLRNPSAPGGHREKNARSSRDRWLTPNEYSMWRNVGIRGYIAAITEGCVVAGIPNEAFRGRNIARNAAFTDYVLSSGLRLAEAGSLLAIEVPASVSEQQPIMGKGRISRHYELLHVSGIDSVTAYMEGERQDVIRRARRLGRYDQLTERKIITEVLPGGRRGHRIRVDHGRPMYVLALSAQERRRLFISGPNGLEPAALWLTDGGTPMPFKSWNAVFNTANARVSTARKDLGVNSPGVNVSPHSLRFTFALMVLVAGVRATDEQLGLTPADPFIGRNYSHVFDEVRDLLGHASVETTKSVYLEPVKGLRRSKLLRGASVKDVWDAFAGNNPLVGFGGGE